MIAAMIHRRETIMVVGATGNLGGQVVRVLAGAGAPVLALVRPATDAQGFTDLGVRLRYGDLTDRTSLQYACHGVDVLVMTATAASRPPPDTIETVDRAGYVNLLSAALQGGVKRCVYISAAGSDPSSPNPLLRVKGEIERRLLATGLEVTTILPSPFMDVWIPMIVLGPASRREPVRIVGDGTSRTRFVASADVAEVASNHALTASGSRRMRVMGPEALSWRDVAAVQERISGHAIALQTLSYDDAVTTLGSVRAGLLRFLDSASTKPADPADQVVIGKTTIEVFLGKSVERTA
jgi:uncharacterized protein YbjT (DUF2867 family)